MPTPCRLQPSRGILLIADFTALARARFTAVVPTMMKSVEGALEASKELVESAAVSAAGSIG